MNNGLFVVFEGIGGVGKSVQISRLAQRLEQAGEKVAIQKEPTDAFFGALVRRVITRGQRAGLVQPPREIFGNFSSAQVNRVMGLYAPIAEKLRTGQAIAEKERQTLFMIDRLCNTLSFLGPGLRVGNLVAQDRYHLSTIAHGETGGTPRGDIQELEARVYGKEFIAPDLTIFVDVDVEEALRRIGARGDEAIYDTKSRMEALRRVYFDIMAEYRNRDDYGDIVVVNGNPDIDTVEESVWNAVQSYI